MIDIKSTDYHPVWLNALADDVTLEGSMMNGAVLGPRGRQVDRGDRRPRLLWNQRVRFHRPLR